MMFSDEPYSVSKARTSYNRCFFGTKLTSLVTTVTAMQEELQQIFEDHSYLDVHHHQMFIGTGGADDYTGELPQEDFRDFSWAHTERPGEQLANTPANMDSRWSYSTAESTATDNSSESEVSEALDGYFGEIHSPDLKQQTVELEEKPDSGPLVPSETADSCDLEDVRDVVSLSDVEVKLMGEDTIARLEAAIVRGWGF